MSKTLRKLENCPNCGSPLTGRNNYCAECGQENTTKNVSIGLLVRDFLDDYFTIDSRLIKSIVPLVTKPGFLTREFNVGRRVKYVPPLRLYIVFSVLFFIIPSSSDVIKVTKTETEAIEQVQAEVVENLAQADSALHPEEKSVHFKTDSAGNRGLDFRVGALDKSRIGDQEYKDSLVNTVLDSMEVERGTRTRKFLEGLSMTGLDIVADDGKQFVANLMNNVPTMMFFLLPIFALIIQLFYFRQRPKYVESIIFSLHFHSFAFLMFAVSNAIKWGIMSDDMIESMFTLAIVIYLIIALKKVFKQKYFITVMKFFGIFFIYGTVMGFSFIATFAITLLTY